MASKLHGELIRYGKNDGIANKNTGRTNWNGFQFTFSDDTRGIVYMKPSEIEEALPSNQRKALKESPEKVADWLLGRKVSFAFVIDQD